MNTQKNYKVYCSLLKIFLNNKKIPTITPLFHQNRFITDFKEKAQLFSILFSTRCSLIPNNSSLPADVNYITDKRLSTVTFSARDIGKIIQNLDSNKAHGHDNLSILMLKICGDSICVPLEMIFKQAVLTGVFPSEWKRKGTIVPIHKKGDKQNIKSYRSVSLLPIFYIFERLIFNEMFIYIYKLISKNHSGFQPGDSCINQLLSINHEMFTSFDNGLEVRSVFLGIFKAFDKVWHEGLIFKLKQNDFSGERLHILSDFLSNRKQRVVLNCPNSPWANVHAAVPQRSILGPLLLLIYINDSSDNLTSNAKLFADNTSSFPVFHDVDTFAKLLGFPVENEFQS